MTATGHAVIGVVIAAVFPNPVIGIPLALASHVAADAFPHWDIGTNRSKKPRRRFVIEAFADLGISFILPYFLIMYFFPQTNLFYAYTCVIAAQFLDWASAPWVFLKIEHPSIFKSFYMFQKKFDNRLDKPWGIIGQVGILFLLVAIAAVSLGTPITIAMR